MEQPVVERGMHVPLLVVGDGAEVRSVLAYGHIVEQILPCQPLILQRTPGGVGEIGGVVAVGKAVGIDLVDEHPGLPVGEEQADPEDHGHDQRQRAVSS